MYVSLDHPRTPPEHTGRWMGGAFVFLFLLRFRPALLTLPGSNMEVEFTPCFAMPCHPLPCVLS